MAKAKIVLGGEIDVATGDELSNGLNGLRDDMKSSLSKPKRIMRPLSAAVQFAGITSGTSIQVVGGRPAAGRLWVVTRVTVIGADDHSTITNAVAALYVGDSSNVGLSQCVRPGQAIPFFDTSNEHAFIVHDREDLFINVTAVTADIAAGQVVFNALAWEYRDSDIDSQFI